MQGVNFFAFHRIDLKLYISAKDSISHKVILALLVVSLKILESNLSHLVIGSHIFPLALIEMNSLLSLNSWCNLLCVKFQLLTDFITLFYGLDKTLY